MTELLNQFIDVIAAAVKNGEGDPETLARVAATSTGLRRAVWLTLNDQQRAAVIKAAVRRANAHPQ